jgi:hypothetical protein
MSNELPIHLYKANAERNCRSRACCGRAAITGSEAVQQLSAGSVLETTSRIQGLQQAADWQALATLPSEVFWRLCQGRMGDAQAVRQVAAKSQAAFAEWTAPGAHDLAGVCLEAFGASGDAASFTQLCQRWTQPWTAPSAVPQEQDQEMRGRQ